MSEEAEPKPDNVVPPVKDLDHKLLKLSESGGRTMENEDPNSE